MTTGSEEIIELRVEDIGQLFHTLDPFPFREKDLDKEAEEFIVGWARELPVGKPIKIIVDYPQTEAQAKAAKELGAAFAHYFTYRADILHGDLKELLRIGRYSLGIGFLVLIACFVAARAVGTFIVDAPVRGIIQESFLILGWVANWRPLEIFLYEWWPVVRRRRLYRRLAAATVEARPYPVEA